MSKKWFTNGEIQVLKEECPEGFHPGRLPVSKETREKMSKNNAWNRMTAAQIEARNKKISTTINSRTNEEWLDYKKHLSEGRTGKGLGKEPWNKGLKGAQEAWNKGMTMPQEFCDKITDSLCKKHAESWKLNISNSLKGRIPWNKGKILGPIPPEENTKRLLKQHITKSENNSFNSSRPEEQYYQYLVEKYKKENIIRQYFSKEYPFCCDFYIIPEKLYIELNLSWTHGGKRFEASEADLLKLSKWQEKAKTSDYYKNAIKTWTERDVKKFQCAEANKLNYKVYYNEQELYE